MLKKTKQLFDAARERTLFRYLFVGGTSYIIELSSLLLVLHLSGSRVLAAAVAFAVGFCVAFFLQKIVAFKDYAKELTVLRRQSSLYILLNAWNYLFTVAFVAVFPEKYVIISRTVALILMSSWNYILYKKVIFKKDVSTPV